MSPGQARSKPGNPPSSNAFSHRVIEVENRSTHVTDEKKMDRRTSGIVSMAMKKKKKNRQLHSTASAS